MSKCAKFHVDIQSGFRLHLFYASQNKLLEMINLTHYGITIGLKANFETWRAIFKRIFCLKACQKQNVLA